MGRWKFLNIAAGTALALAIAVAVNHSLKPAGPAMANFELADQEGEHHRLYSYRSSKAVVIIGQGNGCPIVQKYSTRIEALKEKYGKLGISFLMINPNSEDDAKSVQQEAREYGFHVPILLDATQAITRRLGLTRTAETVIIDTRSWQIIFRGAIDDRLDYQVDKQTAQNNFLEDALSDVLAGRAIQHAPGPAKGCKYSFFEKIPVADSSEP
jgi:peroxiredoxin